MVSMDTSRESDDVAAGLYRAMGPARKISLVFSAYRTGQQLAFAGLRSRHPEATQEQLWHLWARRHLGETLYRQVYGTERL